MTHAHDDAWVRLDAVPADLDAFLDAVGGEPLQIDCGHTTLAVTRAGGAFAVDFHGPGGGWYDHREMRRGELRRYVAGVDAAVRLKRPEHQRPGAEA